MKQQAAAKILTLEEAAVKLRLCRTTVGILLHKGILPGIQLGRKWRILDADVDAALRGGHAQQRGTTETRPAL